VQFGKSLGVQAIIRDISERKWAEQERERLLAEEQVLNEELAAANEELAAANEELASSGEELAAQTEELLGPREGASRKRGASSFCTSIARLTACIDSISRPVATTT